MNGDGNVEQLRGRAILANIPTTETKGRAMEGYVNKPKGSAQILCERGFIDLNGCFPDGSKVTMNETTTKDLSVLLMLTLKCHPEIAGRDVEYAWGYSKLRFCQDFNDAVAKNLKANVLFTNV